MTEIILLALSSFSVGIYAAIIYDSIVNKHPVWTFIATILLVWNVVTGVLMAAYIAIEMGVV